MDALALILRQVRLAIEATGVPPDPLQQALDDAERACRSSLGGSFHHISRAPSVSTKARVAQLANQGLANAEISERTGVSKRHVRRIISQLRIRHPEV